MIESHSSMNKLAGVYRGTVLLHLSHGYCKILIHGVYPQEWATEPDNIPKAEQASALFAGTNNGNGVFSYPNIGSTVWCMFANGDLNFPIYFASALGGENAYGQHELVKLPSEEESARHLVTSGKTHIMWYENGKLSAIVEDPIRTDSIVDFAGDQVSERPIQDKVASEEISNLNCLVVLDNSDARGTISASTHFWNPVSDHSQQVLTSLTGDISTIVENTDSEEAVDNLRVVDNLLLSSFDALSTYSSSYNKNITIVGKKQSTEQFINTNDIEVLNTISTDVNNNFDILLTHTRDIKDLYTYAENLPTKQTIITSLTFEDDFTGELKIKDDAKAGLEVLSSSTKSVVNQGQVTTIKQKLENLLQMNAQEGLFCHSHHEITSDYSGLITIKKNDIKIEGTNADTAKLETTMSGYKNMNGNDIVDAKFLSLVSTKEGKVDKVFQDKIVKVDYSKKVSSKDSSITEILDDRERKVVYSNTVSDANGEVEILIRDKNGGTYSKILMDKAGNITLEASTTVTLRAPNIEIEGITHITGVTTIDSATTIKSTLATIGDTTVKGSSYTGHVHKYMVPAHPAGQANTTPRTK